MIQNMKNKKMKKKNIKSIKIKLLWTTLKLIVIYHYLKILKEKIIHS